MCVHVWGVILSLITCIYFIALSSHDMMEQESKQSSHPSFSKIVSLLWLDVFVDKCLSEQPAVPYFTESSLPQTLLSDLLTWGMYTPLVEYSNTAMFSQDRKQLQLSPDLCHKPIPGRLLESSVHTFEEWATLMNLKHLYTCLVDSLIFSAVHKGTGWPVKTA